jgi:hypothetical protein
MKAAAFFVYEASMKAKAKKSSAAVSGAKRSKQDSVSVAVPKAVSKFAALSMGDSDSDSESENDSSENAVVMESVVDEFPVLCNGVAIGGGGDGGAMSYRAAIMKSKPVATVNDGCGGVVGMTSLKLSGFMKRVRFEDVAAVSTLPPPPPLVAVKKPWKHNRFVSDWNASSSDDDSDCD